MACHWCLATVYNTNNLKHAIMGRSRTDRPVVTITASSYISDFDKKVVYMVIGGAEARCASFSSIVTAVLDI